MGQPADLTPLDRRTANELADLIWTQIDDDEDLPPINDTRAWLLAGEIRLLRAEAELANAAWSTTCEAVDARAHEQAHRIAELEEQLAIAEVNRKAFEREKESLLVKLQGEERARAKLRQDLEHFKESHRVG